MLDTLLSTIDILKSGWCQHSLAETSTGREVVASNPDAVRFSLWGAIYREPDVAKVHRFLISRLKQEGKPIGLVKFNSASSKEEVIDFLIRSAMTLNDHSSVS